MVYLLTAAGIGLILLSGYKIITSQITKESVALVGLGILLIGFSTWQTFTFEGLGIKFSAAIKGEVSTTPTSTSNETTTGVTITGSEKGSEAVSLSTSPPAPPVETPKVIDGLNVRGVDYEYGGLSGRFVKTDTGVWQEDRGALEPFFFSEVQRRARGVQLFDEERGVTISLDLRDMRILYGEGDNPTMSYLYPILKAY